MASTMFRYMFPDLMITNKFSNLNPIHAHPRSLTQSRIPKLGSEAQKTLVLASPVQNDDQLSMASKLLEYARMMPASTSPLVSIFVSFTTVLMLFRNACREIMPKQLQQIIVSKISSYLSRKLQLGTFITDDSWDRFQRNELIEAATVDLSNKIGAKNKTVRAGKFRLEDELTFGSAHGEKTVDKFDGIEVTWKYINKPGMDGRNSYDSKNNYFQLTFANKHRDKVLNQYWVHVMEKYEDLDEEESVLQLYTNNQGRSYWSGIDFCHPSTFNTLAMDNELKKAIMNDLDRFLFRKEFYKKVGKAWNLGYLLYGPPGTGKSSLIAAMANHLKFDVYYLELRNNFL